MQFQPAALLRGARTDFVLSGELGGGFLRLNGETLGVGEDGELPSLAGVGKPSEAPLEVPALASFFVVFPHARATACSP